MKAYSKNVENDIMSPTWKNYYYENDQNQSQSSYWVIGCEHDNMLMLCFICHQKKKKAEFVANMVV